jgi:hypothetical protein
VLTDQQLDELARPVVDHLGWGFTPAERDVVRATTRAALRAAAEAERLSVALHALALYRAAVEADAFAAAVGVGWLINWIVADGRHDAPPVCVEGVPPPTAEDLARRITGAWR